MMSIKSPSPAQFGILMGTAALASVSVWLMVPPAGRDALSATLALLPLTVLVLLWIGRWGRTRGGRRIPRAVSAAETILLAALILVACGRDHLGLQDPELLDRLVFGGLVLLLAHRVGWLIAVLKPSLEERMLARPAWPFFALPLIVYLSLLPWSALHHAPAGDEPYYLLLTHSIAYDFDADLENNYVEGDSLHFSERRLGRQPGDPVGGRGQMYSRHNALLPLLLAPGYRLFGRPAVLALMAVLTAAVCWLTLRVSHEYEPNRPGEALLAYCILAFTPPMLLFSYQVWVEVPAAVLVLLALIQVRKLEEPASFRWRDWLGLILPLALLPLLKLRFLLIAVPIAILALFRGDRSKRRGVALALAGIAAVGCGILLFNQTVFHNPLKVHRLTELMPDFGSFDSLFEGLTGLAFDCAFGLFASAPIWMLLLPAILLAIARRSRALVDFVVVFSLYLLLLSPRVEWFGGWSPPFRYGIVMLPLLSLWLIPLLQSRRRFPARALLAGLGALTGALTLLWLVEPGWTYNLAHGRSHLLDLLGVRLEVDVARLFPSSTRPRAATWLWPPIAMITITGLWWSRRRVDRRGAAIGTIMLLLSASAFLWSAVHKPTRVVEFEDPWIEKDSGQVYPDLWKVYRPHYRGGWILPEGGTMTVPLVPVDGRLTMKIDLRSHSVSAPNGILELRDEADEVRARQLVEGSGEWQRAAFDDVPWRGSRSMKLTLRRQGDDGRAVAILDRAVLQWEKYGDRKERVEP